MNLWKSPHFYEERKKINKSAVAIDGRFYFIKRMRKKSTKFIFVVGGVISGVGKGVATSSIGLLLQRFGYKVSAVKFDPYLNVDAGTMNPIEHGEVFVTKDGMECDQDIGNYERFLNQDITRVNYMTNGQIYLSVIERERNLGYGGKCVEVIPHIPQEVILRLNRAIKETSADILMVEVGGTIGEYQNQLFLEASRVLHLQNPNSVLWVLVSYLPVPSKLGEMKTKPTQHAVRMLNSSGIQPDIIIGRGPYSIDSLRKEKIAIACNVYPQDIISAPDIESIYDVPFNFEKERLGERILEKLKLKPKKLQMTDWQRFVNRRKNVKKEVNIAIVGKYFSTGNFVLSDSYISVIEAIKHASYYKNVKPAFSWLNAEEFEKNRSALSKLKKYDAVIVPGGFGSRGIEGKIKVAEFCRKNKVPYLGLCYGLQIAVIEFARNVLGMKGANTTEIDPKTKYPIVDILENQKEKIAKKDYGGSMRLGNYDCRLLAGSKALRAYKNCQWQFKNTKENLIEERHRHRYEVSNDLIKDFFKKGMIISGINPELNLVEIIELKNHPYFIASQFHPEFLSRPLRPHPLFVGLIGAVINRKK